MSTASYGIRSSSSHALRKRARRALVLWLVFLPLVIIIIVPLLYMASMSFTQEAHQFVVPIRWIPQPPTLLNFRKIFADPLLPLGRWFLNSLLVASVGSVIILFISSLSGYAFARLEFPGKGMLFSLLIFSLMIPAAITLIPSFLLLRDLDLLDTYHAIWWPAAASVTGIFLMRQHFYSIPLELEGRRAWTARDVSASTGRSACRWCAVHWRRSPSLRSWGYGMTSSGR
jgi:ABC-type glycerol-3-phosphate transport system permease component